MLKQKKLKKTIIVAIENYIALASCIIYDEDLHELKITDRFLNFEIVNKLIKKAQVALFFGGRSKSLEISREILIEKLDCEKSETAHFWKGKNNLLRNSILLCRHLGVCK